MSRVALTFDDGPSQWTEPLLEILAANEARATFFVIGGLAENRPDVLRRIVADGHELGNHTWSHPHLARDCDDDQVRSELMRTSAVLELISGLRPRRFRCPYFNVDGRVEAIARGLGLIHTHGTIAPPDWHPTIRAGFISTAVIHLTGPGDIIALHDGIPPSGNDRPEDTRQATVEAVATLLPRLRDRGHEFVTATELLG
jgi:peptidoglycan-N-acetylglucosamine deacetylase